MVCGISEMHATWLENRDVSVEAAAKMGCFSKGESLCFPYNSAQGEVSFVKVRRPGKSFHIEPSGRRLSLWGLDRLASIDSDVLVICEGEIDHLSWMTVGIEPVTSVPNGATGKVTTGQIYAVEDNAFAYLWGADGRLIPELRKFRKFILATDGDAKGRILADELALRLGQGRCYRVSYPAACNDTNDVLRAFGSDGVVDLFKGALPYTPDEMVPITDVADDTPVAFHIGWGGIDLHLHLPGLIVLTGSPNAGKSTLTRAIAGNMARLHGINVGFIQFEDSVSRVREELVAYARAWAKTSEGHEDRAVTDNPYEWVKRRFFVTVPPAIDEDDSTRDLRWLIDRITEAALRRNCKMVIIDPWNECEHAFSRGQSSVEYLNAALRRLKRLAKQLGLMLIVVAHPDKASATAIENWTDWTMYSISGGASWNDKPDFGLILTRPTPGSSDVILVVDKVRHQTLCGPAKVGYAMSFDVSRGIYTARGKVARN